MNENTSLADFIKVAGNIALDFYRQTQGQEPVIRDESGEAKATQQTQVIMLGMVLAAFVIVLFALRKQS